MIYIIADKNSLNHCEKPNFTEKFGKPLFIFKIFFSTHMCSKLACRKLSPCSGLKSCRVKKIPDQELLACFLGWKSLVFWALELFQVVFAAAAADFLLETVKAAAQMFLPWTARVLAVQQLLFAAEDSMQAAIDSELVG